jgi:hypothetical protein
MQTLIQIAGAGHSGSTLLGGLLGNISSAFYMGEAKKIINIHDLQKPLRKRVCKICGENCPVWKDFVFRGHDHLFPDVLEHVKAKWLIDSTKNIQWLRDSYDHCINAKLKVKLIFLLRDGRGVINSRIRKYPERDPATQIQDWWNQMVSSENYYAQFKGPKIRVHYEALASHPEKAVREICQAFELPYQPDILQFGKKEMHPFGGNNGTQYLFGASGIQLHDRVKSYYEKHPKKIQPDHRWKKELKKEHLELFASIIQDQNEKYIWKDPEK